MVCSLIIIIIIIIVIIIIEQIPLIFRRRFLQVC